MAGWLIMATYYPDPKPEASPSLAQWRDRVFRRKSTSGVSATEPESRRAGRAAERARARQASPPRPLQLRWQFQTHPANPMSRRRRTVPFAFFRRSLTRALGHSQWQKPPIWSTQVQPARTRSRGRQPREIRPPNHPGDPASPVLFSRPPQLATMRC